MKREVQDVAEALADIGLNLPAVDKETPEVGKFRVMVDGMQGWEYQRSYRGARALAFALAILYEAQAVVEREVTKGEWERSTAFFGVGAGEGAVERTGRAASSARGMS